MTKEQAREVARKVYNSGAEFSEIQEALSVLAELDQPAKIDTTLRGWVLLTDDRGQKNVWWAEDRGLVLSMGSDCVEWSWENLARSNWTVRALTPQDIGYRVRKWDEWSEEEQYELAVARLDGIHNAYIVNTAIDIATRKADV